MGADERTLLYVRCTSCQNVFMVREWTEGTVCPECESTETVPATVLEGAREYSLASRETGPTIEDIRLARAIRWLGRATPQALRAALLEQVKAASKEGKPALPLGDILVRDGVLKDYQVNAILRATSIAEVPQSWEKFGDLALSAKLVTQEQLDQCSQIQRDLVSRGVEFPFIGHIFVEMGCCKENQVLALLKAQKTKRNEGFLKEVEDALAAEEAARLAPRIWKPFYSRTKREKTAAYVSILVIIAAVWLYFHPDLFFAKPDLSVWVHCKNCQGVYKTATMSMRCARCGELGLSPVFKCTRCGRHFRFLGQLPGGGYCPHCKSEDYVEIQPGEDLGKIE